MFDGQIVQKSDDKTVILTTLTDARGLAYTHTLTLYANNNAAEIVTAVKNTGSTTVTLEMLSSLTPGSLSPFSEGLASETLHIHRLRATWSAEGRLVTDRAEDLQLDQAGNATPPTACASGRSATTRCTVLRRSVRLRTPPTV